MKAKKLEEKCQGAWYDCQFEMKKFIPWLANFSSSVLLDLIFKNVGLNAIVKSIVEQATTAEESFIKAPVSGLIENGIQTFLKELHKGPIGELFQPSAMDIYLNRFDDDKPYPGYYDPVTDEKVPAENPALREVRLLRRRTDPDKGLLPKLNKHPKDLDAFGYNADFRSQAGLDHDATASWRIRGGKGYDHEKADRKIQEISDTLVALAKAELEHRGISGGARPHHKFEKHLISYGISPDVYLNHARLKAKKAGLQWNHLGFADDEKHKLTIPNEAGHLVSFGSAGMGDHILYTLLKDPKAGQHRSSYLARATKIKGDWKKSPYSANSLAIKVLW